MVYMLAQKKREAEIHFGLHRALMNIIEKKGKINHIEFSKTEPEYPIFQKQTVLVCDHTEKTGSHHSPRFNVGEKLCRLE